jgi:hypothetical protein
MNGLKEIREMNKPTPADKYRVQRDKLAKHLCNVIARIGDKGQELAIKEARAFLTECGFMTRGSQQKAWESTVSPNASDADYHWLLPQNLHRKLTRSLACYCMPEDATLNRVQFLKTVVSRIEDDLHYDTT